MYSGYELIWLFFCTSFLGWLLETVSAATHSWQKTMDQKFDDVRLKKIYPNALKVEYSKKDLRTDQLTRFLQLRHLESESPVL